MALLLDRVPTQSHTISTDPAGPADTRPFGLDSLTGLTKVGEQPRAAVDPVTQLSLVEGRPAILDPMLAGTSSNTESDGSTVISVDTDQNDD
ncbi:putative ATP-grasp-modified RiPP [Streptomyces vilmorinianum]|uniref:putative ATP-grasp-modified RiPP n=1 Tax=Streptomyces vilmorinianum TaxID=3051092 RepID=UPI0010FAD3AD|nr:putative ATP-grasp-modified RiPP [Streptomyces vilmorinianum]